MSEQPSTTEQAPDPAVVEPAPTTEQALDPVVAEPPAVETAVAEHPNASWPADAQSTDYGPQAVSTTSGAGDRPELLVGAMFISGLLTALILKRILSR